MGLTPTFSPSVAPTVHAPGRCHVYVCQLFRPLSRPTATVFNAQPSKLRRASVRMLGPFFPNLGDSKLLKSEIVRNEMEVLERDYGELATLGHRYETFDRDGKKIYVERAIDVVDRFAIFLTRLKLSEEFSAQLFVKQYEVRLEQFGLTIDSLIVNTKKSLQMMMNEIPE